MIKRPRKDTYEVILEPDAFMEVHFSDPQRGSLQRVINYPQRCSRGVADSRSTVACDTSCLTVRACHCRIVNGQRT